MDSCLLDLPTFVDLAFSLDTPEQLKQQFLHATLHVLVNRMKLNNCMLQLENCNPQFVDKLVETTNANEGKAIVVNEYNVEGHHLVPSSSQKMVDEDDRKLSVIKGITLPSIDTKSITQEEVVNQLQKVDDCMLTACKVLWERVGNVEITFSEFRTELAALKDAFLKDNRSKNISSTKHIQYKQSETMEDQLAKACHYNTNYNSQTCHHPMCTKHHGYELCTVGPPEFAHKKRGGQDLYEEPIIESRSKQEKSKEEPFSSIIPGHSKRRQLSPTSNSKRSCICSPMKVELPKGYDRKINLMEILQNSGSFEMTKKQDENDLKTTRNDNRIKLELLINQSGNNLKGVRISDKKKGKKKTFMFSERLPSEKKKRVKIDDNVSVKPSEISVEKNTPPRLQAGASFVPESRLNLKIGTDRGSRIKMKKKVPKVFNPYSPTCYSDDIDVAQQVLYDGKQSITKRVGNIFMNVTQTINDPESDSCTMFRVSDNKQNRLIRKPKFECCGDCYSKKYCNSPTVCFRDLYSSTDTTDSAGEKTQSIEEKPCVRVISSESYRASCSQPVNIPKQSCANLYSKYQNKGTKKSGSRLKFKSKRNSGMLVCGPNMVIPCVLCNHSKGQIVQPRCQQSNTSRKGNYAKTRDSILDLIDHEMLSKQSINMIHHPPDSLKTESTTDTLPRSEEYERIDEETNKPDKFMNEDGASGVVNIHDDAMSLEGDTNDEKIIKKPTNLTLPNRKRVRKNFIKANKIMKKSVKEKIECDPSKLLQYIENLSQRMEELEKEDPYAHCMTNVGNGYVGDKLFPRLPPFFTALQKEQYNQRVNSNTNKTVPLVNVDKNLDGHSKFTSKKHVCGLRYPISDNVLSQLRSANPK